MAIRPGLNHRRSIRKGKVLYLILIIPLLWYFIFEYLTLAGIVIAFQNFSLFKGIFHSSFVGFQHFKEVLYDPSFWKVLKSTLILGISNLLVNFPAPIILALLLNELHQGVFKKISQTITYLPHFISTVVLVNIAVIMLSPSMGIINGIISSLGFDKINFLIETNWFRPIYITIVMWQTIGWGTIIYLAAMASIDPELYQAAGIDGASRMRKIWHITLPGVASTIVIIFLLNLPLILQTNFELVLLLQQPMTYATSDVVQTYVYRRGILNAQFDYAATVAVIYSVFSIAIIYVANRIARRFGETSLW